MKVESPEFFHTLQDKYAQREMEHNTITLDRNKAFHASFDTDEASAKDCFRFTRELYERIIEAYDQAILHEINANTVVINGRKYGMLKGHPGLMPTLFGMRVETKIDMPDDWDFYLQERPPMVLTNGDRIRSKNDYDLADWIAKILCYCVNKIPNKPCSRKCPLYKCCNDQPSDSIEDWLKAPADKEGE